MANEGYYLPTQHIEHYTLLRDGKTKVVYLNMIYVMISYSTTLQSIQVGIV